MLGRVVNGDVAYLNWSVLTRLNAKNCITSGMMLHVQMFHVGQDKRLAKGTRAFQLILFKVL